MNIEPPENSLRLDSLAAEKAAEPKTVRVNGSALRIAVLGCVGDGSEKLARVLLGRTVLCRQDIGQLPGVVQ